MSKSIGRRKRGRGDAVCKLPGYGPSRHAPFVKGERPRARHRRRLLAAVAHKGVVEAWCDARGVEAVFMRPNGERCPCEAWTFRAPDKFAKWTPHLGRLMAKPKLRERVVYRQKVYDWEQLLNALEQWLAGSMS
jgi:hypothetical protein